MGYSLQPLQDGGILQTSLFDSLGAIAQLFAGERRQQHKRLAGILWTSSEIESVLLLHSYS
jgi:hypothetical protein